MEISFADKAQEDIVFWRKSGNTAAQSKIKKLLEAIIKTPYEGLGKPEALKHELSGAWSRRIDREHRVVYEVYENKVVILSLRGHY